MLVALEVPLAIVERPRRAADLTAKVERDAFAAASLAEDALQAGAAARRRCSARRRATARDTGGRVVIVDRARRSIARLAARRLPASGSSRSRPEIAAALRGSTVDGHPRLARRSHQSLLYVAVPGRVGRRRHGAVRDHVPDLDARRAASTATGCAARGRGLIVLAAAARRSALLLARSITRPLRALEAVAARVGAGDLDGARAGGRRAAGGAVASRASSTRTRRSSRRCWSQEQFVADASHELRTPLTALRLRLENRRRRTAALAEVERLGAARRRAARARARRRAAERRRGRRLGDVVARARRRVGAARRGARRRARASTTAAASCRAGRARSSRFSTTCSRTRSTPRRAARSIVGRRRAARAARRRRGPGLVAPSSARARSTASGAPATEPRLRPRARDRRAARRGSTAARSSCARRAGGGIDAVVRAARRVTSGPGSYSRSRWRR